MAFLSLTQLSKNKVLTGWSVTSMRNEFTIVECDNGRNVAIHIALFQLCTEGCFRSLLPERKLTCISSCCTTCIWTLHWAVLRSSRACSLFRCLEVEGGTDGTTQREERCYTPTLKSIKYVKDSKLHSFSQWSKLWRMIITVSTSPLFCFNDNISILGQLSIGSC